MTLKRGALNIHPMKTGHRHTDSGRCTTRMGKIGSYRRAIAWFAWRSTGNKTIPVYSANAHQDVLIGENDARHRFWGALETKKQLKTQKGEARREITETLLPDFFEMILDDTLDGEILGWWVWNRELVGEYVRTSEHRERIKRYHHGNSTDSYLIRWCILVDVPQHDGSVSRRGCKDT